MRTIKLLALALAFNSLFVYNISPAPAAATVGSSVSCSGIAPLKTTCTTTTVVPERWYVWFTTGVFVPLATLTTVGSTATGTFTAVCEELVIFTICSGFVVDGVITPGQTITLKSTIQSPLPTDAIGEWTAGFEGAPNGFDVSGFTGGLASDPCNPSSASAILDGALGLNGDERLSGACRQNLPAGPVTIRIHDASGNRTSGSYRVNGGAQKTFCDAATVDVPAGATIAVTVDTPAHGLVNCMGLPPGTTTAGLIIIAY